MQTSRCLHPSSYALLIEVLLFLEAGQTVSHSYEVLTNATTRLKEILERKLEAAVDAEDVATMQRYSVISFSFVPALSKL